MQIHFKLRQGRVREWMKTFSFSTGLSWCRCVELFRYSLGVVRSECPLPVTPNERVKPGWQSGQTA